MYIVNTDSFSPTKNNVYFGIDLGTTYTLVAVVDINDFEPNSIKQVPVKFIRYEQKSPLEYGGVSIDEKIASIIAIKDGRGYCGNKLYELKGHPDFKKNRNIFYHWKLDLGVQRYPLYPDAADKALDTPAKVASKVLNFCRMGYVQNKEARLYNTVITVPASFQANQRQDVIKAAELANIEISNQVLIDEPNAAFVGYFNDLSENNKKEFFDEEKAKNILVIDFGGGTCDLSILAVQYSNQKGIMIGNKAISRYNDLGGQDIDQLIVDEIIYPAWLKKFTLKDDLPLKDLDHIILPQLATVAEIYKKIVFETIFARFPKYDWNDDDLDKLNVKITNQKLNYNDTTYELEGIEINAKILNQLYNKIHFGRGHKLKYQDKFIKSVLSTITEVLEKANLSKMDIDFILTVGGSVNNPFLIRQIQEDFKTSRLWFPSEPDKLVAKGAAIYSFFHHGFKRSIVQPICSETIGIETKNRTFYPLIEKGEELPMKASFPNFKLQSNLTNSIIVPICINSVDYIIQELSINLTDYVDIDSNIRIDVELDTNKVFKLSVFLDDKPLHNFTLENPFFIGSLSKDQVEFVRLSKKLENAKQLNNPNLEKTTIIELLQQFYEIKNYHEMAMLAEYYLDKFDNNNATVLNYHYIGNKNIGRIEAAKKSLEKAIIIEPEEPAYRYNYSLLIEETDGVKRALDYLEEQNSSIKSNIDVKCRIILLKNRLGVDIENDARTIASDYEANPQKFNKYTRKNLLGSIFRHLNLPYNFDKDSNDKERDGKVLIPSNKPVKY